MGNLIDNHQKNLFENLSQAAHEISAQVERVAQQEIDPFAESSRESLIHEAIQQGLTAAPHSLRGRLHAEFLGWGPIEGLLTDDSITEILINSPSAIWFEKRGQLNFHDDQFTSPQSYQRFLNRLCDEAGIHMTIEQPFAQGRWSEFRVQIVGKEIARNQTLVSLRRHPTSSWTLEKLAEQNWCSPSQLQTLQRLVRSQKNILIAGPTGCGKTSFMNALLQETSPNERSVIIEDTEEIHLPSDCCVRLLTRKDPSQLLPTVDQSDLLKHALRLRPDRIIVGEIRGAEAKDLIMALSTGHHGSMSTLHASNAHQALIRLEMLVQLGAPHWSLQAVRRMISFGVDYVAILERTPEGHRRLNGIFKLVALEEFGFLIEPVTEVADSSL